MVGTPAPPAWGWVLSTAFWMVFGVFSYYLLQKPFAQWNEEYFLISLSNMYLWFYSNITSIAGGLLAVLGVMNSFGMYRLHL
jgi:hypothetical protein